MKGNRALYLHNVCKSYGNKCALNDINISIYPSEFVGLLGQNGAGKSTLFQLLTGLFSTTSGNVEVYGNDIRTHAVLALANIGVVFQQSTLDLSLSVFDNLFFHCLLHGLSRKEAKISIQEELCRFDLVDEKNTYTKNLSGGNRRKIELIRALLHSPKILLMDEATVGLDPASRISLLNYVHKICKERNLAVLWSTHIVDELDSADRVIFLDKGHILADGSPNELISSGHDVKETLSDVFLNTIKNNKFCEV